MKKLLTLIFVLALAIPLQAQTGHFNASDNDHVFNDDAMTDPALDGEEVRVWDAETPANMKWNNQVGGGPLYEASAPSLLEDELDFGAQYWMQLQQDDNTPRQVTDLINPDAYTIIASIYPESISTTAANTYDNEAVFADADGYVGIHLKDVSGTKKVICYNYDGSDDSVSFTISVNTKNVIMCRKTTTQICGSLNNGSESCTDSGNTQVVTNFAQLGANIGAAVKYDGRIGEIKFWDTDNAGGNLASELSAFMSKWVDGGGQSLTMPTISSGAAFNTPAVTQPGAGSAVPAAVILLSQ